VANARGKKSTTKRLLTIGGLAAMASLTAIDASANGSLQLCPTGDASGGAGYGYAGGSTIGCPAVNGTAFQGYAFSLHNQGDGGGGYGLDTSTARITGYDNGTLELKGTNGISALNQLQMNGNKITNLAKGTADTDAVNVSQLKGVTSALGGGTTVNSDGTVKAPAYTIGGTTYNNVGDALSAAAASGNSKYFHTNSTAADSQATGGESIAVGGGAKAVGAASIALGNNAQNVAASSNSIAIGGDSKSSDKSVTIGNGADTSTQAWSTAIGTNAKSTGQYGVALGGGAVASGSQSVALGANSVSDRANAVSMGSSSLQRQIIQVAKGTADTDAVNVSQLKGVTGALGGGSAVNADGTIKAPTYTVQGQTATDVGSALSKIDGATTKNTGDITTINNNINNLQKDSLQWNGTAGAFDAKHGTSATNKIIDVAAGTLNATSTDAVNGSQLYATNQNVSNVTNTVNNITNGGGVKYFHTNSTGADSQATGGESIAVGGGAKAVGAASIALGNNAQNVAASNNSIAIGGDSKSSDKSVTIGNGADTSTQAWSTAIGTNAKSTGQYGVALGGGAVASGSQSVALGANSVSDRANAVSMGSSSLQRQIIQVAKGTADTDAVNVSQLKGVTGALGGGSAVNADGTVKAPAYTIGGTTYNNVGDALSAAAASGADPLAVKYDDSSKGAVTLNKGGAAVTIGNVKAATANDQAVNFGQLKSVSTSEAAALGGGSTVNADGTITKPKYKVGGKDAVGVDGAVTALDGRIDGVAGDVTNLGDQITNITNKGTKYFHANSTGVDSSATGVNAIAVGESAQSAGTEGVAMGKAANVSGKYSVALGSSSTADRDNTVSLGSATYQRQVVNMAMGTADTDAVNVSQLKGVTSALGGGSAVNTDGTIKAPTYTVQGQTANDVGTALSKIDGATTKNTGDITTINNNINNLQKDSLQWDTAAGSFTAKHGTSATNKIANVAAGTAATDAVNFGQLTAASTSEAAALGGGSTVNADGTITKPKYKVGGKDAVGVDGAVAALDGRIDGVAGDVTNISNNINNGTVGLVQQASKGAKLTVGKDTDGSVVDFLGTAGARQLTNVAKGAVNATSVDAINGSQLFGTAQSAADAFGGGSTVDANGKITKPKYNIGGADYNNVGDALSAVQTTAAGTDAMAVKYDTAAKTAITLAGDGGTTLSNVAAGKADMDAVNVKQLKDAGIIDGNGNSVKAVLFDGPNGEANVAGKKIVNVAAGTAATDAVNFGQLTAAAASEAAALGGGSTANADGTITLPEYKLDGGNTTADNVGDAITNLDGRTTDNSSAITNITNNINNGTIGLVQQAAAGEKLTVGKETDGTEVNFTGKAGDRMLTGLSAGTVDNAAVNVSQLKGAIDTIGGGASVDPTTGKVINPTWIINKHTDGSGGTTVTNVGDAITNIDDRVTNVQGDVTNITNQINNGSIGMVQQAAAGEKLTVGKDTDGTEVNFTGTAGDRMLTGVAAGTVDTAAVNLAQLKGAIDGLGGGASVDPTTGAVTGPTYNVTNIDGTTTEVHNVGDAITTIDGRVTNIDGRVTNVEGDITNIMNGTSGMVQQAAAGEKLTVGKDTDGKVVDFTGTAGERQLTGVAAGAVNATSVDAINGAQLFGVSQSVADAMGGGSTVNPDGTISAPSYTVGGTTVNNVGDAITNIDGRVTQNAGDINTINNTLNNITNGGGITYFHANSTLADSQALGMESVAIGGNAQSRSANSVALGSNSVADRANSVSVGSAGNERQITNVAAGTADTDAVNVAQLKASGIINPDGTTNTAVTYDKNADGTTNYSSITMGDGVAGGTTIHNLAEGTAGNDAVNVNQMNQAISSVTNIAQAANNPMFSADGNRDTEGAIASGSHATAMGANANASAANSVALGANSVADRASTVSVGSAGNERQITNVAAGTATTDAVNVGQMNESIGAAIGNLPAGMTAKDYADQQVKGVQSSVNQVARGAYSGVAAATALSMIPDVDLGKTIAVGVGTANYKGYQATAIGASVRITQNLKAKLGAGISAAGTTVGVGASYQW
jgi:autotransporter adhesin